MCSCTAGPCQKDRLRGTLRLLHGKNVAAIRNLWGSDSQSPNRLAAERRQIFDMLKDCFQLPTPIAGNRAKMCKLFAEKAPEDLCQMFMCVLGDLPIVHRCSAVN